jgi:hypothetical protein
MTERGVAFVVFVLPTEIQERVRNCPFFIFFLRPPRFIVHTSKQKCCAKLNQTNVYLYLNILFSMPEHVFGKISKPQNVCNLANPIFLREDNVC